ncbi:hypothetical protein KCU61_g7906, partial [Aureobasidium melanogenum]
MKNHQIQQTRQDLPTLPELLISFFTSDLSAFFIYFCFSATFQMILYAIFYPQDVFQSYLIIANVVSSILLRLFVCSVLLQKAETCFETELLHAAKSVINTLSTGKQDKKQGQLSAECNKQKAEQQQPATPQPQDQAAFIQEYQNWHNQISNHAFEASTSNPIHIHPLLPSFLAKVWDVSVATNMSSPPTMPFRSFTAKQSSVQRILNGTIQRLVRDLNEARTTIAYLRVDLSSTQSENARLQAKIAHFQAKFARLRAHLEHELLEDLDEDSQSRPDPSGNEERYARRFRGSDQETQETQSRRPRTETRTSIDVSEDLQTDSPNVSQLDGEHEANKDITVWVNQDGKLETDSQVDDLAWGELEAIWADQVLTFNSKDPNWAFVDLKGKCLKTALFPRVQNWTKLDPGEYACRNCTNTRKICVGKKDDGLVSMISTSGSFKTSMILVDLATEKFSEGTISPTPRTGIGRGRTLSKSRPCKADAFSDSVGEDIPDALLAFISNFFPTFVSISILSIFGPILSPSILITSPSILILVFTLDQLVLLV